MFAVPNGGYRRPVGAAILKATGVAAGVPDTVWIKGGQTYGLELRAPGGRVTENQHAALAAMEAAGAKVCVAEGLEATRAAPATGAPGPSPAGGLPEHAGLLAARARGQEAAHDRRSAARPSTRNHGRRQHVRRSAGRPTLIATR